MGHQHLFRLDAGLSNTEAFAANAFFTLGEVRFEIPTGVIADTWGRRTSYLLGAATLLVSTLLYLATWHLRAPFWAWAAASMAIGLGSTFFSGATEAWLVDALAFTGSAPSRQGGDRSAMLTGTLGGGFVAQLTNLGVPYLLRAGLLGATLVAAAAWMKDLGFSARRGNQARVVLRASPDYGLRQPAVRWGMLAAFCSGGIGIYGFYAAQPFLLQLYGDPHAFGVGGVLAAIVAASQIVAGVAAPYWRRLFARRTHVLIASALGVVLCLYVMSRVSTFATALVVLVGWIFSMRVTGAATADVPERSDSFRAARHGAVVRQLHDVGWRRRGAAPARSRRRRARLPLAYFVSAFVQLTALPFLLLARRANATSDRVARDASDDDQ